MKFVTVFLFLSVTVVHTVAIRKKKKKNTMGWWYVSLFQKWKVGSVNSYRLFISGFFRILKNDPSFFYQ